jgi:zinc protease
MHPSFARLSFARAARPVAAALAAATIAVLASAPAQATKIERLVTPGGIEAWVVRDPAVPLVALDFAFAGAANQDPADKPGVANLAIDLLDEGAGELDAKAFKERMDDKAIELSFSAGRDFVRGTLRTLKDNKEEAFELLRLALNAPRFDASAVERVRSQIISQLQRATTSPNDIARRVWWSTAFPNHPYGKQVEGTLESVPRITVDELKAFTKRSLARDRLKIAVVGDIDLESAGKLIDATFGPLPAKSDLAPIPDVTMKGVGRRIVVDLDVPQAVVTFGGPGIARNDPDFMAAYIVNHILGGGSFSSRLYREVREKRGLAYGVFDSLLWLNHTSLLIGGTATRADATGQAIDIIEEEFKRLAAEGPTEDELVKAKTYLKGSYALGFDTSSKIASQLVQIQLDNLGIDYIDKRSAMIDAVTLADAKRVSKRLLDGLLIAVVGKPKGVISTGQGG